MKRRVVSIILVLMMLASVLPQISTVVHSEVYSGVCGKDGNNLIWTFDDDSGKLVISGIGEMQDYNSSSNQTPWYDYSADIISVEIQKGVTSIGNCAFYNCSYMETASLPNTVTSIGNEAFESCNYLEELTIPNNVQNIGDCAFRWSNNLDSFVIPASVNHIGYWAFYGTAYYKNDDNWDGDLLYLSNWLIAAKDDVSSALIKQGTIGIADELFYQHNSLVSASIPSGVLHLGSRTFQFCEAMESVDLPADLQTISDYMFCFCYALETITVPASVTSIGNNAFQFCSSLTEITIPNGVTSIGDCAFEGCDGLTSILIPDSVTQLGEYAFARCWAMTDITLSNNLTEIGTYTFNGCSMQSITIPEGVTQIGDNAFYSCGKLEHVQLPISIQHIGATAFGGCRSLKSIVLPDGLSEIEPWTFLACYSLESVTIPNSITTIEGSAFYGCGSLTSVTIPASVTSIGDKAFGYGGEGQLQKVDGFTIYGYSNTAAETYAAENGFIFIDLDSIDPCADGHDWGDPTYVWSADNSEVTATRVCQRNETHIETETVQTSAVTTQPTCTDKGKTVFTASFTNTAFATQIKTVEIAEFGHDYHTEVTAPTCTEVGYTTYTCSRCGDSYIADETAALGHTPAEAVKENEAAPTCTAQGGYDMVVYCSVCNAELSREHTTIDALGHDYELTGWSWTGFTAATTTFTCKNDETHVETVDAEITSERTEPTVDQNGSVVYTATVMFEGTKYTDTKTDVLPALGHDYELSGWTWTGYTAATATFTDKNGGDPITVNATITSVHTEPTCVEEGTIVYTATVTFEGKNYTDTKTETLPANGHTPGEPVKENETAPTCTEAGGYDMVTYCIVCNVELGREHTTLDAIGHDYELSGWTWTGYTAATATFTCKNDTSHVETVEATITNVRTEPTPDAEGSVVYTATVSFEDSEYTDVKTEVLPALGHEYELTGWNWTDYTAATATFHDKTADRDITVDAIIISERTEPTCETEGSIVYTATVSFEGQEYTDTKTETLDALGHDWNEPEYVWADDYSTVTASRTCKNDESHIETETVNTTSEVIKEATVDEEGEVKYTATFENTAFDTQTKTVKTPKIEKPEPKENPFKDVKEGAYYYDAVLWAVNADPQITAGTSATTFSPNDTCTRAQVVTFLWRAMGQPEPTKTDNPFKDVKSGAYYYKAVLWAVENGVTAGTSATTFSPNQGCTRAQVVTFLWRTHGQPEPTSSDNPFKDVTGGYYYTAVLWAVENGVTAGTSATTFSPNQTCTRGQIVTFLYRDFSN